MSEPYDYGKRADDLADAMRRYLIGINTGGIAIALTFAASMAEKGVHPESLEFEQPEVSQHEASSPSNRPNQPLKKDLGDAAWPSAS